MTELGEVNDNGVTFHYPKAAKLQQYCGDQKPCAWHLIETSDVQMNHLENNSAFSLDPLEFQNILDLDTGEVVDVRR